MDFSKQQPLLNSKSVRILYFSDVHEWIPIPMVESILKPLIRQNDINLIFIGGDLGNDKHNSRNDLHVNCAEVCNEDTYEDLFLSKLASFKVPIIFVPGNHDHISFFHNKYADGKKGIFNIHNRVLEIAPGLYCLGVGGSCPAYDKSHNLIWEGFPNKKTDLDCTISKQCISSIPENSSVIQFTHCPPSFAYSSQVNDKEKQLELEAGSENLTELYDSLCQSHDVLLYLHGHCHQNFGSMLMHRSTVDTHVLSSGSIRNKYYSVIALRFVNEKWVLKQQSLYISSDF